MKLIFTLFFTVLVFLQAEDYMTLHVDATDITRGLLTSEIEIHTSDTEIVMWYPKWIPGIHGPRNPVENLGGVYFYSEEGNKLKWHRDSHEPFRFTCKLDQDTKKVRIKLRYICNQPNGNSTGVDSYGNSQMGIINWNTVLLYPAWKNNQIKVVTKLTLPNNWKFATALQTDAEEKQTVTFKETTLEELIDCPLICGQYLRTIDLKVEDFPPHYLHLVAESSSDLNIPEDLIQKYRRCIQQAQKIFFKPHFRKYHFLVFMSDRLPSMGLEHLSSSLNGIGEKDFFTEWSLKGWVGSLLPHEYVHSWCGKYRRPIGMHTPDYHSNKDTRLLWIYEGLTTYLGEVLAVRSGFLTPEDYIPRFTRKLNYLIKQTGRSWRPLEDTCVCSYTLRQRSENWGVWRRGQDYYDEGLLLWLEIDTMIRHRSFGEKSLDDFCIQFFGKGNSGQVLAFDLLEVYQILDNIVQYDWKNFIEGRIKEPKEKLPLNLVNLCGYRMIYTNKASGYLQELQRRRKYIDASDSLGILFSYDGQIRKIIPGMVGDLSGIAPGMQVTGINGQKFTVSNLENAIANSIVTGKIELLVFERYTYKILTLKYDGGAKYLRLERVPNSADMLTKILRPVK